MRKMMIRVVVAALLAANALPVLAQEKRQGVAARPAETKTWVGSDGATHTVQGEMRAKVQSDVHAEVKGTVVGSTFNFIAAEGFGGKIVKGAPYSAEAVTEEIQTLSDGNRIVRRNSSAVYRDSEGRTRHERTFRSLGPYASAGEPPQTISIYDPVDSVSYTLDVRSKTARKLSIVRVDPSNNAEGVRVYSVPAGEATAITSEQNKIMREKVARAEAEVAAVGRAAATSGTFIVAPTINTTIATAGGHNVFHMEMKPENIKSEDLGTQMVEGVSAEGKRTTLIIAAGDIGNEQPIHVVTETWYSPELQVVVLRKHTDPRQGEITYRLSNLNRAEPSRSLFEVPADYTVKESVAPAKRLLLEQEIERARIKKEKQQ